MYEDLSALDDSALDALRVAVLTEQERRARLATIPEDIARLASDYAAGGGDLATLRDAISTAASADVD